jgi:hypothetical protein
MVLSNWFGSIDGARPLPINMMSSFAETKDAERGHPDIFRPARCHPALLDARAA